MPGVERADRKQCQVEMRNTGVRRYRLLRLPNRMGTRSRYDDAAAVSRRGDAGDAMKSIVEEPFDSAHGPEPVEGPQRRSRPGVA